jgi:hypothetical protein
MITIEKEVSRAERVTFNVPFACVQPEFGDTSEVLPRLPWQTPLIIWLDYDKRIDFGKLDDIKFCIQNMLSGSALAATFRVSPNDFDSTAGLPDLDRRLRIINEDVRGCIPDSVTPGVTANLDTTSRLIMNAAIDEGINDRNLAVPEDQQVTYRQFLFFWYDDGTPMVTIGGLVMNEADSSRFEKADLADLPFIRQHDEPYRLRPPKLTLRERRYIDQQLPRDPGTVLACAGILTEDLDEYARLYRYFPWFVEAEI